VVSARADIDGQGARVELVLDNSGGAYDGYGYGSLGALQRGGRLQLTPGYVTAAGAETPAASTYWIESIERLTGVAPRLVVRARDGWWLLERWRARRQFVWAAGVRTVSTLLSILGYRVGLGMSAGSTSAAIGTLKPAFTVHAGESAAAAIRRLLSLVPDVGWYGGDAELRLVEPLDDDASTYALGVDHAVTAARYVDLGPAVNRARVVGNAVYAEAFDFAEISAVGELVGQVVDRNLDNAGDAADRADAELRDAALAARADEVTLFGVHCGAELYDVVELTDSQAGLSAAPRRILGLSWRYETGRRPRYEMTLRLGAV
jgi:hypothetical protein